MTVVTGLAIMGVGALLVGIAATRKLDTWFGLYLTVMIAGCLLTIIA